MKKVYKYVLEKAIQTIDICGEILSVESQGSDIVIYALVEVESTVYTKYEFRVYGTGHDISDDITDFKFLGTAKINNGQLMFHIFYK